MNRRDRRAAGIRGKVVNLEPVRLLVDDARRRGCLCDPPQVYFLTGPMRYGEIGHTAILHDDDCPLMAGGNHTTAIVITKPETES